MEMLLELCVRYPLRGLPENFFCKRSGDQLEEYTDPDLVGQLDPLPVPVSAFEFFPTLDGGADAASCFGSKPLWTGELLEFDELRAQSDGIIFPAQAAPLLQDMNLVGLG